jgi:predicted N-acetyltransferase YhbS
VRLSPVRIGQTKALLLGPMPGPVDPARILVAELVDGAFDGVSGPIRAE